MTAIVGASACSFLGASFPDGKAFSLSVSRALVRLSIRVHWTSRFGASCKTVVAGHGFFQATVANAKTANPNIKLDQNISVPTGKLL